MRKIILTALIFVALTSFGFADTITIDTTGWSQEKKNMVEAMVSKVLFDNAITHSGITVRLPSIEVKNPSKSISVITKQKVSDEFDTWKTAMDDAIAQAQITQGAKEAELSSNEFKHITLSQIDSKIDADFNAVTTLAELKALNKAYWKKLIRYIKAREE